MEIDDDNRCSAARISRRRALQLGGAVGGALWLAPVIESLTAPPAAASALTAFVSRGTVSSNSTTGTVSPTRPTTGSPTFFLLVASAASGLTLSLTAATAANWNPITLSGGTPAAPKLFAWWGRASLITVNPVLTAGGASGTKSASVLGYTNASAAVAGTVTSSSTVAATASALSGPLGSFLYLGGVSPNRGWTSATGWTERVDNGANADLMFSTRNTNASSVGATTFTLSSAPTFSSQVLIDVY